MGIRDSPAHLDHWMRHLDALAMRGKDLRTHTTSTNCSHNWGRAPWGAMGPHDPHYPFMDISDVPDNQIISNLCRKIYHRRIRRLSLGVLLLQVSWNHQESILSILSHMLSIIKLYSAVSCRSLRSDVCFVYVKYIFSVKCQMYIGTPAIRVVFVWATSNSPITNLPITVWGIDPKWVVLLGVTLRCKNCMCQRTGHPKAMVCRQCPFRIAQFLGMFLCVDKTHIRYSLGNSMENPCLNSYVLD